MKYDFISDAGNKLVREFPMGSDIPQEIVEQGVVYRKKIYAPNVVYHGVGFKATDGASSVTKWQREHLDTY